MTLSPYKLSPDKLWPALEPRCGAGRWLIGLSGGMDSCLLLTLLAELRDSGSHSIPPLCAIHVNHQLHADAPQWADHCARLCDTVEVPLETVAVNVDATGDGPEAAAREARYQVFEERLGAGEVLLLAHHADDQVETFFLRLMRGAGTRGLAGMPAERDLGDGHLLRPLLPYTRAELLDAARERGLQWVEDPSNALPDADRNFLRQSVLPQLENRWPGYRDSVMASMDALGEAERNLYSLDEARLAAAAGEAFGQSFLDLAELGADSPSGLSQLLRRWLESLGIAVPIRGRLLEFSRQCLEAMEDALPELALDEGSLRRYRNQVYLVPSMKDAPTEAFLMPAQPLLLPTLGVLRVEAAASGMRLPAAGGWQLRWRSGGERCRPQGRDHSQALKQLLQEHGVPPWVRERLPLLYDADELAAVADLWVCEGHQAAPGEPAYRVQWTLVTAVAD